MHHALCMSSMHVFFNDLKVKCATKLQEFATTATRMVNRLTTYVKDADKISVAADEAFEGQFSPL